MAEAQEQVHVPASEVLCVIVNVPQLVAKIFSISRTEATRQVKAGAVEVIEATTDRKIEYRKIADIREPMMVYSQQILTYIRWGHRWRKIRWES